MRSLYISLIINYLFIFNSSFYHCQKWEKNTSRSRTWCFHRELRVSSGCIVYIPMSLDREVAVQERALMVSAFWKPSKVVLASPVGQILKGSFNPMKFSNGIA